MQRNGSTAKLNKLLSAMANMLRSATYSSEMIVYKSILLIAVLCGTVVIIGGTRTYADSNTKAEDYYFTSSESEVDYVREHVAATTGISYYTSGFAISLTGNHNAGTDFSSFPLIGATAISDNRGAHDGSMSTHYTISMETVKQALLSLNYTPKAKQETVTIYLTHIFAIRGDLSALTEKYGYISPGPYYVYGNLFRPNASISNFWGGAQGTAQAQRATESNMLACMDIPVTFDIIWNTADDEQEDENKVYSITAKYIYETESGSVKKLYSETGSFTAGNNIAVSFSAGTYTDSATGRRFTVKKTFSTSVTWKTSASYASVSASNSYGATGTVNGSTVEVRTGSTWDKQSNALTFIMLEEIITDADDPDEQDDELYDDEPDEPDGGDDNITEEGNEEDAEDNTESKPEILPAVIPTPIPDPGPYEPSVSPVDVPFSQNTLDSNVTAILKSDYFDVTKNIPSTEEVYVQASLPLYTQKTEGSRHKGSETVKINVTQSFTIDWYDSDENFVKSQTMSATRALAVNRKYEYSTLDVFIFNVFDNLTVLNDAFLTPFSLVPADKFNVSFSRGSIGHIPVSEYNVDMGIIGSVRLHIGVDSLPSVFPYDGKKARTVAESSVGTINSESAFISVNGTKYDAYTWAQKSVKTVSMKSICQPIPRRTRNSAEGTAYESKTSLTYRRLASLGANTNADYVLPSAPLINGIHVFTPVYTELFINECDDEVPNRAFSNDVNNLTEKSSDKSADVSATESLTKFKGEAFMLYIGSSDSYGTLYGEEAAKKNNPDMAGDFLLSYSNIGYHPIYEKELSKKYDYSRNISGLEGGSYIEGNYMELPFDVLIDGSYDNAGNYTYVPDYNQENDMLLPKGIHQYYGNGWRFYIPMWVDEGDYVITLYSVAVNGRNVKDNANWSKGGNYNAGFGNYVATDSVNVHISGRMFGLTLYDIDSQRDWIDVFRDVSVNKYSYSCNPDEKVKGKYEDGTMKALYKELATKLMTADQLRRYYFYYADVENELMLDTGRDKKYSLPIRRGSSPLKKEHTSEGILKTGYNWSLTIDTTGSEMSVPGAKLEIIPEFYLETEGKRVKADVYYQAAFAGSRYSKSLVKIGDKNDGKNVTKYMTDDRGLAIPLHELNQTWKLRGKKSLSDWKKCTACSKSPGKITAENAQFSNNVYAQRCMQSEFFRDVVMLGYSEVDLLKSKQSWYFSYSLPPDILVVPQQFEYRYKGKVYHNLKEYTDDYPLVSGQEPFFVNSGTMLVNFCISAYNADGVCKMCEKKDIAEVFISPQDNADYDTDHLN